MGSPWEPTWVFETESVLPWLGFATGQQLVEQRFIELGRLTLVQSGQGGSGYGFGAQVVQLTLLRLQVRLDVT